VGSPDSQAKAERFEECAMLKEFREFALKGNVVDLAIGVIIGAAFGKIVSGLVDLIIMPVIGLLTGGVDFADMKYVLKPGDVAAGVPEVAVQYGAFINTIVQFAIIAWVLFLIVKAINTLKKKEEAAPAAPARQEVLLEEIRDLLKR
jgi:large conductance mechanosensitive channel